MRLHALAWAIVACPAMFAGCAALAEPSTYKPSAKVVTQFGYVDSRRNNASIWPAVSIW
jgi:hypothetical protein